MAFDDLVKKWAESDRYPKKTSLRYKTMDAYQMLLEGTICNVLKFPFSQEENGVGNYIELLERRPSVFYAMPKIIVDQTSSLTFGEAHAPAVRVANMDLSEDPDKVAAVHEAFEHIVEALDLDAVMLEAMQRGAMGSVMIVLEQMPDKTPYLNIIDGKFCKPYFVHNNPKQLDHVDRVYSLTAEELDLAGYTQEFDPNVTYYIKVTYNIDETVVTLPMPRAKYEKLGQKTQTDDGREEIVQWVRDDERSSTNPFSFLNVFWIRNLEKRGQVDGECSFEAIKDITLEISYLLSQIGRGYRYAADPQMVVTEGSLGTDIPVGGRGAIEASMAGGGDSPVRSPARVIPLPSGADAKLLEISANGLKGATEHVRMLREYGLELLGGMKSEAKDEGGTQSGKALHLLHQALVWLVERFRTSYGNHGYLPILRSVIRAVREGTLLLPDVDVPPDITENMALRLMWPQWTTPTGAELQAELEALATAAGSTPQFPRAILPIDVIAQRAAAAVGVSDQNRVAAELERTETANPPLTAKDAANNALTIAQQSNESHEKVAAMKPAPALPGGAK